MPKSAYIKLILLDVVSFCLLALLLWLCLYVGAVFSGLAARLGFGWVYSIESQFMGRLSLLLVPLFGVIFAMFSRRITGTSARSANIVAINALLFCVAGIVVYIVLSSTVGFWFIPTLYLMYMPSHLICVALLTCCIALVYSRHG